MPHNAPAVEPERAPASGLSKRNKPIWNRTSSPGSPISCSVTSTCGDVPRRHGVQAHLPGNATGAAVRLADMRGYLVRVAVDQAYGGWNSPMDPATNEFVYVPIPESREMPPELATPYQLVLPALVRFSASHPAARKATTQLPPLLLSANMHLDPDFRHLTYGDSGTRRGKGLTDLGRDDVLVFYAGLRPVAALKHRLVYALVGLYRVDETVRVKSVASPRWSENAHTRCVEREGSDIIVRAQPCGSGRLKQCIPIGGYRERAYRVDRDLLDRWGDLSCKDGFLQRSAVLPTFREPARFMEWFEEQGAEFVSVNNP